MLEQKVKSICIAGGGSSGWLTAARTLFACPDFDITVVESPNVPIIGVGEATLLGFDLFLNNACNIPVDTWSKECDATVKLGTKFTNWYGNSLDIWSPFLVPLTKPNEHHYDLIDLAIEGGVPVTEFYRECSTWYEMCIDQQKIPSTTTASGKDLGVGYNLDAVKLANFLSKYCNKTYPKLKHIKQNITDVETKDGNINHLVLDDGSLIKADFFIDCTGFRKVLSNTLEGSDWKNYDTQVFTNAAVASQINYKSDDEPQHPYVDAEACDLGWIWKTPIKERIGSGLCYNRNVTTKEEAEKFFIDYWGEDRLRTGEFNHINYDPEYNANNWRGNCVSVGLSSGFVEPLESSGLALMTASIECIDQISQGFYTKEDRDSFNKRLSFLYENTFDFIGLHYFNNQRSGPFWDKVKNEFDCTDTLFQAVSGFKNMPTHTHFEQYYPRDGGMYHEYNWKLWTYGSGIMPATVTLDSAKAKECIRDIKNDEFKASSPGLTNREWSNR
jgi:tryptophan halogenase